MTNVQAQAFLKFSVYVQRLFDDHAQREGHTGYEKLNPTPIQAIEEWAYRTTDDGKPRDRRDTLTRFDGK